MSPRRAVTRSIAVIGCGHWGPNHVRAFSSLPGVRVAWIADLNPAALTRVSAQSPGIQTTTDYARVLADSSVDAVVVATPASTHAAIAFDVLRAGKHVLCEKPLGVSSAECERLVDAALPRGLVLMVGHVFLFNPGILEIRRLLTRRALGRLSHVYAQRTNQGPVRPDVDVAWDLAAHEISICNFLFDTTPLAVAAQGRSLGGSTRADVANLTLTYPGPIAVQVTVNWLHQEKVRRMSFVGESGTATFDDLVTPTVTLGPATAGASEGNLAGVEPLLAQARHFVEALACGHAGRADGAKGWDVVRTLEAVEVSMRQGGRLVDVSRPLGSMPAA